MIDIPGYEGLYAVTSCGKIWSHKRKIFLVPEAHRNGYLSVTLCKNGVNKRLLVHRLVAAVYVDNPHNYSEVNHKDETRSNNCANNLEWCTRQYNNTYGNIRERIARKQGKSVICAETGETYYSIGEAARKTGFTASLIAMCCRMEIKQAHGLHFYFEDYYKSHYDEIKRKLKKRLVYCIQTDTYYSSCKEAGVAHNITASSVGQVCNGKRNKVYGLTFRYVERQVIP